MKTPDNRTPKSVKVPESDPKQPGFDDTKQDDTRQINQDDKGNKNS